MLKYVKSTAENYSLHWRL